MTNFEPFDYGRSMSIFLSEYMYTSPEVAIREMLANCRDQYLHKKTFGGPYHNRIFIILDPVNETFRCIDYATGIMNLDEFKMMGSNTMGKRVGDRVSSVENPDPEMIGQFHVGKASYVKMSYLNKGNVVSFYSNSGKEGHILQMLIQNTDIGKELGWEDPVSRLPADLAHNARPDSEPGIGLTVEVHNVIYKLLDLHNVANIISEQFGILLARKQLKIFMKYKDAPPGDWRAVISAKDLDIDNEKPLKLDDNHSMTVCLRKEEKPPYENIRLCVKHIYIKSIHAPYKCVGWINYNMLRLNGPRDGFLSDDRSEEMFNNLDPYLDANFERQAARKPSKIKTLKELTKLFEKMVENVLLLYERDPLMLEGGFQELSKIKGKILRTDKKDIKDLRKETGPISKTGKGKGEDDPGDPEGEIVIPLRNKKGRRRKDKGGKGSEGGTTGTWRVDEENGKVRDYRTGTYDQNRPETGPIQPQFTIVEKDIGLDKPVTYMENAHLLYLNSAQPATYGIMAMQKHYRQTSLGPFMAEALAEFITRNRSTPTSIIEYRQMVNDIYTRSFFSGNG